MTAPNVQNTALTKYCTDGNPDQSVSGMVKFPTTNTVLAGSGAQTATAAQLLGGLFQCTITAAFNLTTDTAANIIAALGNVQTGMSFDFTIVSLSGAFTLTLVGGTGVTIVGAAGVATVSSGTFKAVVTSATTVSIYRM